MMYDPLPPIICEGCKRPIEGMTLFQFSVDIPIAFADPMTLVPTVGWYHPECYRAARKTRLLLRLPPRQRMEKGHDYYDLIELPTGEHIPVPIAKKLVGKEILAFIPVSPKFRGDRFFYCEQCWKESCEPAQPTNPTGHSFFRCQKHKPTTTEETTRKEEYLVQLILLGNYRKLKYIRATRTRPW